MDNKDAARLAETIDKDAVIERLREKNEELCKAVSIIADWEEFVIPIPESGVAKLHIPRPMTTRQWTFLMDALAMFRPAIVRES